jgi:hypothetical protein
MRAKMRIAAHGIATVRFGHHRADTRTIMRLLPLALAAVAIAGSAGARTVYVGNDGLDGAACGTKAAPCRSISQGITLAAAGDTVLVGPGYYGDLDGDGNLGEPGEEGVGFITLTKAVRVISRDGAAATYIDGSQPLDATPNTPVTLEANGATFGGADHGFTVANYATGVGIFTITPGATIAGNVVLGGYAGIIAGGGATVTDDRVLDAGTAFSVANAPNRVERCAAIGGGFSVGSGPGHVIRDSVAVGGGGFSFSASGAGTLSRSASIGSSGVSVDSDSETRLDRLSVYGNGLATNCGIAVSDGTAADVNRVFFGDPAGPGADPADLYCATDPIAPGAVSKKEIRPRLQPLR